MIILPCFNSIQSKVRIYMPSQFAGSIDNAQRATSIGPLHEDINGNSGVGPCEELNLQPNGSIIPPPTLRLLHICSLGPWPTFLGILQSPKICSVLEDSVSMAAMTESCCARKGKKFSSNKEQQVCCSILHISQDQIVGNGQWREDFGTKL
jgi:hypothetical protein